jgi:hypothetical protein
MALDGERRVVVETATPQRFVLYRHHDGTGVSGTGGVATGIVWPDGSAAMRWRADDRDEPRSTSVWFSVADLLRVHGHAGDSEIIYLDPADGEQAWCPRCHHAVGVTSPPPGSA